MATPSQKIHSTLTKPWFFNAKHNQNVKIKDEYLSQAATIIAKCKKLLTLMHDDDVKKTLHAIIKQTDDLIRVTTQLGEKPQADDLDELLEHCQNLQRNSLYLPQEFPTERNLNAVNYKIAAACFYLLVLSVCLTLGATFGAWYFGFLTASYFTNTLVGALSAIGVPAASLGLVSYGLYKAGTASQEDYATLPDDISTFCDSLVEDYELEAQSQAELSS